MYGTSVPDLVVGGHSGPQQILGGFGSEDDLAAGDEQFHHDPDGEQAELAVREATQAAGGVSDPEL